MVRLRSKKSTGQSASAAAAASSDEDETDGRSKIHTISQEDLYLLNCHKYGVDPDPSVLICLKSRWKYLETSRKHSVLPLLGVLDDNEEVRRMRLLANWDTGDVSAKVVADIIVKNTSIQQLDISYSGITDTGMAELSSALAVNNTLESLNLSYNSFTEKGAEALRSSLMKNTSIKSLDLSCNALGFQTIENLRCSCKARGMQIKTNGNYVFEEILNAVSHGFGFIFSMIGSYVLISEVVTTYKTDFHFWAVVLYSASLMILDHVGIYLLIAGSYTPILMITLHHVKRAQLLLIGQWVAALTGSVFAACSDLNSSSRTLHSPATGAVELVFFLVMGFGCFFIWDSVYSALQYEAVVLLLAGGAAYVLGIIFFILGEVRPIYHVVWHLFVMLGAALHWFAIYFFVVNETLVVDIPALISAVEDAILN